MNSFFEGKLAGRQIDDLKALRKLRLKSVLFLVQRDELVRKHVVHNDRSAGILHNRIKGLYVRPDAQIYVFLIALVRLNIVFQIDTTNLLRVVLGRGLCLGLFSECFFRRLCFGAGCQRQKHNCRKQECKHFFHDLFPPCLFLW